MTRDAVLSLEVVLADGRVTRTGGRNVKDVAGYSLTHLFVGSQGTLRLVTEATLRLRPAPPAKATMLAFFATLETAGEAVAAITAAGLTPCTLELVHRVTIAAVDDWHNLGLIARLPVCSSWSRTSPGPRPRPSSLRRSPPAKPPVRRRWCAPSPLRKPTGCDR